MTRAFDHVLIVMFENQYRGYVLNNPYFRGLARQGMDLANHFGVMHPSQPNYIASISGALHNITDDDRPAPIDAPTLIDRIEASPHGLTWRAYMQSYIPQNQPWTPNLTPEDHYPYVTKHNPFASFKGILDSPERWACVVDEAAFWSDLLNGTLPNYAWFTPNMWNDGHYLDGRDADDPSVPRAPSLVDQAARWLEGFFDALRFPGPDSHLPPKTLVCLTFDESEFEADWTAQAKSAYDGPNQIYTVLLGDGVPAGYVEHEGSNHYSLLRTVEVNFGLEPLGTNDVHANWVRALWGERFVWSSERRPTGLTAGGALDTASLGGVCYAAYTTREGDVRLSAWTGAAFTAPMTTPARGDALALVASSDRLVLAWIDRAGPTGGPMWAAEYRPTSGWTEPACVASQAQRLAMTACVDGRVMAAYQASDGRILSRLWANDRWAAEVDTGFATDGAMALATLGATLLLVHKTPGRDALNAVTYNTAPFNVVRLEQGPYSGPIDNTGRDRWSPSGFAVAHFAERPVPWTGGEPEPAREAHAAGGPLAALVSDGVLRLVHTGPRTPQLLTETFSIHGLMTPLHPVSYDPALKDTTSNGFGTLAEASWSPQETLGGLHTDGLIALAHHNDRAFVFTQSSDGAVWVNVGAHQDL